MRRDDEVRQKELDAKRKARKDDQVNEKERLCKQASRNRDRSKIRNYDRSVKSQKRKAEEFACHESKLKKQKQQGSSLEQCIDIFSKNIIEGQLVHLHCRHSYVNPIVIKGLKRKSTSPAPLATPSTLRSEKQFNFKEDCLFCGNSTFEITAKTNLFDVHAVQTTEFQTTVEQICIERKDEWATQEE
ncbi:unnamed protein product [Mytilus edulis]|uniref:Uncharacterized protein n=1 Tax=Mytilus edulis TaxID=6550 RepID=A0A8S3T6Q9_MYTED|nr:unnamed protein product [Mytilus edulis]